MSLKRGKSLNTRYSYKFKLYVSKYLPEYLAIQVDMGSTLEGEITQNISIWTMQYEYMYEYTQMFLQWKFNESPERREAQ